MLSLTPLELAKKGIALNVAAEEGQYDVVTTLLTQYGAQISNENKENALYAAAEKGFHEIVNMLLTQGGADFSNSFKGKILQSAADKGHYRVVTTFLAQPDAQTLNEYISLGFILAAKKGHYEIVIALFTPPGAQISKEDKGEVLGLAARSGRHDIVTMLLTQDGGAQISIEHIRRARSIASENGHHAIAAELSTRASAAIEIQFNELIQKDHVEAFVFAFENESLSHMKIAQSKGAVPSRAFMSQAIFWGSLNKALLLCKTGFDLTMLDKNGRTALDEAFTKDLTIAKMLIENGVQFGSSDNSDRRRVLGQDVNPELMKLFACAIRKKYPLSVTFIEENQIGDYLSIIKSAKKPINEIFAIRVHGGLVPHWYTVQLLMVKNEINLLTVDSEGFTGCRWYNSYLSRLPGRILQKFPKSNLSIYIPKIQRQHDWQSCSAFCLYDVIDLHKMNRYLPKEFDSDIFTYVKSKVFSKDTIDGYTINFTHLPLRMMRAMQSTKLLETIIPSYSLEEQTLPVNKKGETALMSSSKRFILSEKEDEDALENGKKRNVRISYKFDKMLKKAQQYLIDTSLSEINDAIENFGLPGLKKRILTSSASMVVSEPFVSSTPSIELTVEILPSSEVPVTPALSVSATRFLSQQSIVSKENLLLKVSEVPAGAAAPILHAAPSAQKRKRQHDKLSLSEVSAELGSFKADGGLRRIRRIAKKAENSSEKQAAQVVKRRCRRVVE